MFTSNIAYKSKYIGYETIFLVNDRIFEACFEACQGVYY
jgi:hypothetical protein